jgi:hypothetical protein
LQNDRFSGVSDFLREENGAADCRVGGPALFRVSDLLTSGRKAMVNEETG